MLELKPRWLFEIVFFAVMATALWLGCRWQHPLVHVIPFGVTALVTWYLHILHNYLSLQEPLVPPPRFLEWLWEPVVQRWLRMERMSQRDKQRLRRLLDHLRMLTAQLPDGVVLLGKGYEVRWFNPAAETLLGLGWPRDAGTPIVRRMDHPVFQEYLAQRDFSSPLELPSPVDGAKMLSVGISPFGNPARWVLVARDITQGYHLEQAQRDFVANVSHELRTPLTVFRGILESLEDEPLEPGSVLERSLRLMSEQSERMRSLVDDLLTLSHLEMDARVEPGLMEQIAVPSLLAQIVEEARTLSGERGHIIRLSCDPHLMLLGNEQVLRSAFTNLVSNAVIHTPDQTEIQLQWGWEKGVARLVVRDNGLGIPAYALPSLTQRFFRVDKGRSRRYGGTGLGLAITKQALRQHNAHLEISSAPGKGSVFTCLFSPDMVVDLADPALDPDASP